MDVYERPVGRLATLAADAISSFCKNEASYDLAQCNLTKRALLLIALHLEPELGAYFAQGSPQTQTLLEDLRERVLPMLVPSFTAGLGQDPRFFCNTVMLLTQLWPGEPIWDDAFCAAHAEQ